jgi:hypothetical protein
MKILDINCEFPSIKILKQITDAGLMPALGPTASPPGNAKSTPYRGLEANLSRIHSGFSNAHTTPTTIFCVSSLLFLLLLLLLLLLDHFHVSPVGIAVIIHLYGVRA